MTRNQLPEGVGKKIVEALKRQAEADITPVSKDQNSISNSVPLTEIQNLDEMSYEPAIDNNVSFNDNIIIEEESINLPLGVYQPKKEVMPEIQPTPIVEPIAVQTPQIQPQVQETIISQMEQQISYSEPSVKQTPQPQTVGAKVNMPPNVATLKNLIASLPAGVTKQTGAQIIRQTFEAMGLPMTSVLKEAQNVQDELKSSSRECLIRIQEYKAQILQLENSVQDYQKNITQINDIVSLFLLTDNQ